MKKSINDLKNYWVIQQGIAPEDFLVLALHVLKYTHADFLKERDHLLQEGEYQELTELLERRAKREPVAYLTGHKEFFGRDFHVTTATLIPRPDSECLIEDVLHFYFKTTRRLGFILDIGTGSGALAITISKELETESLNVFASDTSAPALEVAQQNAALHKASITFHEGSLLIPYQKLFSPGNSFFIIANLPYVSSELLKAVEADIKEYEPLSALVSEDAGLAHYKALLKEIRPLASVCPFTCWLEISPEQADPLREEVRKTFPQASITIGKDLAQRSRFLRFSL